MKRVWNSARFRLLFVVACVGLPAIAGAIAAARTLPSNFDAWTSYYLAMSAFAASVVALFQDNVRRWIWRPFLDVHYFHGRDYCEHTHLDPQSLDDAIGECYYFSICVKNYGARSADDVEVIATSLQQWTNNKWEFRNRFALNLKWAYVGTRSYASISPGVDRFCNVGHIIDPTKRSRFLNENDASKPPTTTLFSLDLEALPNHAVHLLSPGKYRLFVKIVAANHDALDRLIEFEITGAWIPNDVSKMLSEGLIMELKTLPR